jgi:hypothetical protein
VIGDADGTPGDLAGSSILDGRLVSEAVDGRTDLVLGHRGPFVSALRDDVTAGCCSWPSTAARPATRPGLSFAEEAAVMRALGAEDALNLDGGDSTTMTLRGTVVTRPSDATGERPIGDAILPLGA